MTHELAVGFPGGAEFFFLVLQLRPKFLDFIL
jgi:hypothetical protein